MYTVIICSDGGCSLARRLEGIRHRFEAKAFAGERAGELLVLEAGAGCRIAGTNPVLILPKQIRGPLPEGEFFAVVANSDWFCETELIARYPGAVVLTCGMRDDDALTYASCGEDQAVVSVQRRFGTMGGRQVLPQDLPLRRQPEISRFDLLACCALLLLCGWGDALTTLPL